MKNQAFLIPNNMRKMNRHWFSMIAEQKTVPVLTLFPAFADYRYYILGLGD
jgi:hypothetical protein